MILATWSGWQTPEVSAINLVSRGYGEIKKALKYQANRSEMMLLCIVLKDVYLRLIFLSQSWSVSVRGVGHSHIDIVWLYLEWKNNNTH